MWCFVLSTAIKHSEPLFFTLVFTETNTKLHRKWGLAHIQLLAWRLKSALWIYYNGIHSCLPVRAYFFFGHHTLVPSWLPSGPGQTYMETTHEKITAFSEFISTKLLPGYHLFCCVLWLEAKPKTLGHAQLQWGVQVRFCPLLGEAAGFGSHVLLLLLAKYFSQL